MDSKLTEAVVSHLREAIALMLWDVGAIKIDLNKPFRLVSGNHSPIYVNCRLVISVPAFMQMYVAYAKMICEYRSIKVDFVAGGETAGIPFAAYLAQGLSLPMLYVRKATKGHGISTLIEGQITLPAKVILVEDLITDAQSKLQFIDSIKVAGGMIKDVLVLFDRAQGGRETLQEVGVELHALTDMTTALRVAHENSHLTEEQFDSVNNYLASPEKWHVRHGLTYLG